MPLNKPIEKRYHSITEVAVDMGVNASQLRYWEKEFTLLKPRTNARGKRFYSNTDIQLIKEIHWLVKEEGHTLEGARKALRKRSVVAASMESKKQDGSDTGKEELRERLNSLRNKLVSLQEKAQD